MLMKLLLNVFERAKSKLTITHTNQRFTSDSSLDLDPFDIGSNQKKFLKEQNFIQQEQPRSSLSKWLCTTPSTTHKPISPWRSNKVRRTSSWRSLKERTNNSITSRACSVDELHRNNEYIINNRRRKLHHSPISNHSHQRRKFSNDIPISTRYDRLSSTTVKHRQQNEQKLFSTLSHQSTGGDSGYSEESFPIKPVTHTACAYCHCEQRLPNNNQSYTNLKSSVNNNQIPQKRVIRTLQDKRRRNLSCDSSLWARTQSKRPIVLTSSPVFSEPNHLSLQRHFTTINMKHNHPSNSNNSNVFGELNLAAIELDSLRTSLPSPTPSYSSSSSSSISNEKQQRKTTLLVWHEYKNSSLLSKTNGTNMFSVKRGDQVRLIKRIGKSTLLVEKEDDGSIGFLPYSCLAQHQINTFLSLKGLRETVL